MLPYPSVKNFTLEEWTQYVSQSLLFGSCHKDQVMLGFPWFGLPTKLIISGYFVIFSG